MAITFAANGRIGTNTMMTTQNFQSRTHHEILVSYGRLDSRVSKVVALDLRVSLNLQKIASKSFRFVENDIGPSSNNKNSLNLG